MRLIDIFSTPLRCRPCRAPAQLRPPPRGAKNILDNPASLFKWFNYIFKLNEYSFLVAFDCAA